MAANEQTAQLGRRFSGSLLPREMRPNRQLGEHRAKATMVSQRRRSRAVRSEKLSQGAIFLNLHMVATL